MDQLKFMQTHLDRGPFGTGQFTLIKKKEVLPKSKDVKPKDLIGYFTLYSTYCREALCNLIQNSICDTPETERLIGFQTSLEPKLATSRIEKCLYFINLLEQNADLSERTIVHEGIPCRNSGYKYRITKDEVIQIFIFSPATIWFTSIPHVSLFTGIIKILMNLDIKNTQYDKIINEIKKEVRMDIINSTDCSNSIYWLSFLKNTKNIFPDDFKANWKKYNSHVFGFRFLCTPPANTNSKYKDLQLLFNKYCVDKQEEQVDITMLAETILK